MATKTFYVLNTAAPSPNFFGQLQEGGSAPTAANSTYGWGVAKTSTAFWRARLGASATATTAQASSYVDALTIPTKGTGATNTTAGDSFVSPTAYVGIFAAGNWTLNWNLRTGAATVSGRIRLRVFASTNADGTGARQLTSATQVGATVTMNSTTVDFNSSITWNAPQVTLSNEYLFFSVEFNVTTAGSSNSCTAQFRVGTASVTTTDYQPFILGSMSSQEAGDDCGTANIVLDPVFATAVAGSPGTFPQGNVPFLSGLTTTILLPVDSNKNFQVNFSGTNTGDCGYDWTDVAGQWGSFVPKPGETWRFEYYDQFVVDDASISQVFQHVACFNAGVTEQYLGMSQYYTADRTNWNLRQFDNLIPAKTERTVFRGPWIQPTTGSGKNFTVKTTRPTARNLTTGLVGAIAAVAITEAGDVMGTVNTINDPRMLTGVNGSPGTMPTGWFSAGPTQGFTQTLTYLTDNFDKTMRMDLTGTNTSNDVFIETSSDRTIPKPGETWRFSVYSQVVQDDPALAFVAVYVFCYNSDFSASMGGPYSVDYTTSRLTPGVRSVDVVIPPGTVNTWMRFYHSLNVGSGHNFSMTYSLPYAQNLQTGQGSIMGSMNVTETGLINWIPSPNMEGAASAPGALPTGWELESGPACGVTFTALGVGTANGRRYLDVNVVGTYDGTPGAFYKLWMGPKSNPATGMPATGINYMLDFQLFGS